MEVLDLLTFFYQRYIDVPGTQIQVCLTLLSLFSLEYWRQRNQTDSTWVLRRT